MADFLESLVQSYKTRLERYRNRSFFEAAMAACALVATASGKVSVRERFRMDQVMETLEALRVFDPHEGVDMFNDFAKAIQDAPSAGHESAISVVLKETEKHPEKAELLIRICSAVSEVDGRIPLTEQIEIVALCTRIGVDPEKLGVNLATDPTHLDAD